jgi:hypothetical protein
MTHGQVVQEVLARFEPALQMKVTRCVANRPRMLLAGKVGGCLTCLTTLVTDVLRTGGNEVVGTPAPAAAVPLAWSRCPLASFLHVNRRLRLRCARRAAAIALRAVLTVLSWPNSMMQKRRL